MAAKKKFLIGGSRLASALNVALKRCYTRPAAILPRWEFKPDASSLRSRLRWRASWAPHFLQAAEEQSRTRVDNAAAHTPHIAPAEARPAPEPYPRSFSHLRREPRNYNNTDIYSGRFVAYLFPRAPVRFGVASYWMPFSHLAGSSSKRRIRQGWKVNILVELVGIEPTASSLRTTRSPS